MDKIIPQNLQKSHSMRIMVVFGVYDFLKVQLIIHCFFFLVPANFHQLQVDSDFARLNVRLNILCVFQGSRIGFS